MDVKLVTVLTGLDNPQGFIALSATSGSIEFRNISLQKIGSRHPEPTPDGVLTAGNGVTLPRVTREVRPRYTSDAMARKIHGRVLLAVIGTNGKPGQVSVVRSLDPHLAWTNKQWPQHVNGSSHLEHTRASPCRFS